jgi:hypothetical protein
MVTGAWDMHHGDLAEPHPYGDDASYRRVADATVGYDSVEDWGCGGGGLRRFIAPDVYRGVDGSKTPFADVRADLRHYRSEVDVVVLRHVLEHNDEWQLVLDNAWSSARRRLIVVLFTPVVEVTRVMFREPDYGQVPVIAFKLFDIRERLRTPWNTETVTVDMFDSPGTAFGKETIMIADR